MGRIIRFECARCIHKDHSTASCAVRGFRWALYYFMLTIPILHNITKRPKNCPNRLTPPTCYGHFILGASFVERDCGYCYFYTSCNKKSRISTMRRYKL